MVAPAISTQQKSFIINCFLIVKLIFINLKTSGKIRLTTKCFIYFTIKIKKTGSKNSIIMLLIAYKIYKPLIY